MANERGNIVTFKQAGVILPPDEQLYLLPLLQSKVKSKAPLDRLPQGTTASASSKRIAFTTQDESDNSIDWTASTHVFPSAYPRSHYASTAPPSSPPPEVDVNQAKQDRTAERESRKVDLELWSEMSQTYSVESFYPPSSQEEAQRLADNLLDGKQPQLWSCVERLVPSKPVKDGITLFLAHANGFHKEVSIFRDEDDSCSSSPNIALRYTNPSCKISSTIWQREHHESAKYGASTLLILVIQQLLIEVI